GEQGIRTLGTLAGSPDFESGSFGHSDSSPPGKLMERAPRVKRLAEREGFEPSVPCGTHDFQSCTFGHSVISPCRIAGVDSTDEGAYARLTLTTLNDPTR